MTAEPDLLLRNGRVLTMDGATRAEAVAIAGDRIAAVGTTADLDGLRPRRVIDLPAVPSSPASTMRMRIWTARG